jgi:L-fuculose-phosphate aldolase
VSYGETVERAYWWTEILDAYCRMLMLARGLGRINYFSEPEAQALLNLKGTWGYKDPRAEMANCELCANDVFRESWPQSGVQPKAFEPPRYRTGQVASNGQPAGTAACAAGAGGRAATDEQEALIQAITDRVIAALSQRQS